MKRKLPIAQSTVDARETVVYKRPEQGQDAEEIVRKMNDLAACGRRSESFDAPEAWITADKQVAMQRLHLGPKLSDSYFDYTRLRVAEKDHRACALFWTAGRSLKAIHQELAASVESRVQESPGSVASHGDFGFSNLFEGGHFGLIVLDPLPVAGTRGEVWEISMPQKDLGMFVSCVVGRGRSLDLLRSRPTRAAELLCQFLDGYGPDAGSHEPIFENAAAATDAYFASSNTKKLKRVLGPWIWKIRLTLIRRKLKQT